MPSKADETLAMYQRATRLAERRNYQRAIDLFRQVLAGAPDHVEARRNLGMALLEAGNVEEAKVHLEEALRINPRKVW